MRYKEVLEQKAMLKAEYRRMCEIPQYEERCWNAKLFGVEQNAFHDLPFDLWRHQARREGELLAAMDRDVFEVQEGTGKDLYRTPCIDWVDEYRWWLAKQ
jgi:hypothetical protein